MEAHLKTIFKKSQNKTILPIKEMVFNQNYKITKMERVQTRFGSKIRCLVDGNHYVYLPGIFNETLDDESIAECQRNIYYLTKDRKGIKGSSNEYYELNIHAAATGNFW